MKILYYSVILFISLTNASVAQSIRATVQDHYNFVKNNSPRTERICQIVDVPVYGQAPANTSDTLAGALIGGAIGNQFGNGSGKDAMTVLGAILGADAANKNRSRQIVGYTQETRCENKTVYVNIEEKVYSHSTITFVDNGRTYSIDFKK